MCKEVELEIGDAVQYIGHFMVGQSTDGYDGDIGVVVEMRYVASEPMALCWWVDRGKSTIGHLYDSWVDIDDLKRLEKK